MEEKFIYRERELQKLQKAYEGLEESGFRACFIVGEPGTGKSVLLDQFMEWVIRKDEGVLVTGCSCSIGGMEEEYRPFKDILQSIVEELESGEEGKRSRKEKWSRVFGASADVLLKVAPDLIENLVPMGSLLTSVGAKVLEGSGVQRKVERMKGEKGLGEEVLRATDQYAEVLKLIARRYRLVMYFDNLQWADKASVELLQRLTGILKRLPVLLVGCYRGTDIACAGGKERLPLEAFVTRLKVEQGDVFVNLDEGGTKEKERLTGLLLDTERNGYSERFRKEMFRRTGGNPLFVKELLRTLKENRSIGESADTGWRETERLQWEVCPLRIEGVIREKVAVLEKEQLNLLVAASVQGQFFLLPVLARMTGKQEDELLEVLTGVLGKQRHLVYEESCFRVNGYLVSRFCFSDDFLRGYLYRGLGGSQRVKLHGQAARLLEELYGDRKEDVWESLAFQYEQAGEREKATEYLKVGVEKLGETGDYAGICSCCERGLNIADEAVDKGFFRLRQMEAMRKSGSYPVGRLKEVYRESDGVKERSSRWMWERWELYMLEGDLPGALHWLGGWGEEAEPYRSVAEGITNYWCGEFEQGRKLLDGTGATEDGELAAWCGLYRMLLAFHCGEYEQAEILLEGLKKEKRSGYETGRIALLAEVWLAFLDEDRERMREGMRKESREGERKDYIGKRIAFFAIAGTEEGTIWGRLEELKNWYRTSENKTGITLYGLAVCRLCVEKGLYEAAGEVWKEIGPAVEKRRERCYWGELCLLRGRCLKESGKEEEGSRWMEKGRMWMEKCGEKRFLTGVELL